MQKFKFILSLAAIAAIGVCTSLTSGCASSAKTLLASPPAHHIVHITGNGNKDGIVYDPLTGQASLGVVDVYASLTTIPVFCSTGTNGQITLLVPDVSESFELAGKSFLFGSAGQTHTLASGNGVITQVGGQHQPINEGFYSTNNLMTYAQLNTATGAATPLSTQTVQTTITGTNGVSTTTTTTTSKPSPTIPVPGF